jgi:hypothetical protein
MTYEDELPDWLFQLAGHAFPPGSSRFCARWTNLRNSAPDPAF